MEDTDKLAKFILTAPVISTLTVTFLAGLLIEINRFFPDLLVF